MSIGRLFEGFFVVAHRGASGYEPENTLRAVRRALEMGVDAVEVDVRLSADGVPVVIHDETLERTTSGRGRVRDYPVDELRMLDAGSGERIPLLAEVLDEVKGKAALFLELKEVEAAAPSLSLVEEKGMLGDVLFISLQPEALAEVRRMSPRAYLGLIYFKPGEWILEAKRLGCSFVLPHYRLATEKAVSFAHRLKLRVVAWTVDDPATAAELKKRGVDGVASNFPDRILPLRG
ncbi:glycerophosphodiester phosphodiesterase [Thermofilum pendens]|uniref:glycerophosphodiester phosphodiesterase n=1 Tax=Thermofilum pendens TaxID=2269 RepID=UPI000A48274C|nr:glycerophosphodiester phosphodiesterase [Thermofilum pendens]